MYTCRPEVSMHSRASSTCSHRLMRSTKEAHRAGRQLLNSASRLSLTCSSKVGLGVLVGEASSPPLLLFTMSSRSRTVHMKLRVRWSLSVSE